MEPALRYIAAAGEFEVGSIPNLDVAQRLLLVHRLVREGFLIVVRQPRRTRVDLGRIGRTVRWTSAMAWPGARR